MKRILFAHALFLLFTGSALSMQPDPEIFDGSSIQEEKQSFLQKIINKRPDFGRVGPVNSMGNPDSKGGSSEKSKQQSQEQGQGQNSGSQGSGNQGEGIEGEGGGGGQDENAESVEKGEGLGGQMDEGKDLPPGEQAARQGAEGAESQEGQDGEQGSGGPQGEEGEQGVAGTQGEEGDENQEGKGGVGEEEGEMIEPGDGIGGKMDKAGVLAKLEKVSFGDPDEMIKQEAADEAVGNETSQEGMIRNVPMAGKNKGISRGVEKGESVPKDL